MGEKKKERAVKSELPEEKEEKIVVKVVSVYESKENKDISLAMKHTQDDWLLYLVWISS